jgi:hypothetical protein
MLHIEVTFVCLSVCGLVSVTSSFVGFSWNSVLYLFTQVCIASLVFVMIGWVSHNGMHAFLCVFPHLVIGLGEMRYSIFSYSTIALFWVLWKYIMWKPYITEWCKWISVLAFNIYCSLLGDICCKRSAYHAAEDLWSSWKCRGKVLFVFG